MQKYIFLLITAFLLTACSSANKLYEKGKYEKAYIKAIKDLKKNKSHKDKVLLNKAFAKILDKYKGELGEIDPNYIESDLKIYDNLQNYYFKGEQYLSEENIIQYEKLNEGFYARIDRLIEEAKKDMEEYEKTQDKQYAQSAYYMLSLAEKYLPEDYNEDISLLLEDARKKGTVVYNITTDVKFGWRYNIEFDVRRQMEDLEGWEGLIKVIFESPGNEGDCDVTLEFGRIYEDQRNDQNTRNFSKKIVDRYETKIDKNGKKTKVPVYKNVKGSVKIYRDIKTVEWEVYLNSYSSTSACDLRSRRFDGYEKDEVDRYEIFGDRRAIPERYLRKTNHRFRRTEDMLKDILYDMYRDIREYIYRQ